ncbi:hypothetical protein ACP4OV_031324 [Aristida adscensionis]
MGEKDNKVEAKTAVYKVHVHCGQCERDIESQFREFQGVEDVKVEAAAGKVTVKGFGFDVEKLRAKVEKGCRKKVELIPPKEGIVTEVKTKEEELKVITVKVPLHCPECAARVKEILLEHKSIYAAKTDLGKDTCVVEGAIDDKDNKLLDYIYRRTRKRGTIEKVEKKVIIKEEKVEVKKKEEKKEEVVAKVVEKVKEVIAPYFIPCTHPHFIDYSHPWHRHGSYGGGFCSPYPYHHGVGYTHSELTGYQETAFLHCSHPNEFISEENPYACSVM